MFMVSYIQYTAQPVYSEHVMPSFQKNKKRFLPNCSSRRLKELGFGDVFLFHLGPLHPDIGVLAWVSWITSGSLQASIYLNIYIYRHVTLGWNPLKDMVDT